MKTERKHRELASPLRRLSESDRRLAMGICATALFWTILSFFDRVIGSPLPGTDHGILRNFLVFSVLFPTFFPLLRPAHPPTDDNEGSNLHRRIVLVFFAVAGILGLIEIVAGLFSILDRGLPFAAFFVSRIATFVLIAAAAYLLDRFASLMQVSDGISARSVQFITAGTVLTLFLTSVIPGTVGTVFFWIGVCVLSFLTFIFALQSGWIVRLWRRQKYQLWFLSFGGVIAASVFLVLIFSAPVESGLTSSSPVVAWYAQLLAHLILATEAGLFIRVTLMLPTARAIDRRHFEVDSLSNFSRLMVESFDREGLLATAMEIASDVSQGHEAWVVSIRDGDLAIIQSKRTSFSQEQISSIMQVPLSHYLSPESRTFDASRGLWDQGFSMYNVGLSRLPGSSLTGASGNETESSSSKASRGREQHPYTLVIFPLRNNGAEDRFLGVLKSGTDAFDKDDISILRAVSNQITLTMNHSVLIQQSIHEERLRNEMEIARDAQMRLLPRSLPDLNGFDLYAESEPAHLVGGDYYDTFSYADGSVGVLIADVSGKGAGAALYMGMVKGIIRGISGSCTSPAEVLSRTNSALHRSIDPRFFVTMTCARLSPEHPVVEVARAGHCPALIISPKDDQVTSSYHRPDGMGLALASDPLFSQHLATESVTLEDGETMIFFSDGLVEAMNRKGDEIGYEEFGAIARSAFGNPLRNLRECRDILYERIDRFCEGADRLDDSTIVVLRRQMPQRLDQNSVGDRANIWPVRKNINT